MNYSEKVLIKINEIKETHDTDLVEATAIFCEENDIEIESFLKNMGRGFIERLKYEAIQNQKVRKCVAKPSPELPL